MKTPKELCIESWAFFKLHWKVLIAITIGFAIGNGIYNNLLPALFSSGTDYIMSSIQDQWMVVFALSVVTLMFIVFFIISILISILQKMAPLFVINQYLNEKPVYFKETTHTLLRSSAGYLWVYILGGLIVCAGFIVFIIPGIYFLILFSFASIAYIADGKKGLDALTYSKELFRGRFWSILTKLVYPILYVLIVFAIPLMIIAPVIMFTNIIWLQVLVTLVIGLPAIVAFVVLSQVIGVYFVKVYREASSSLISSTEIATGHLKAWAIGGLAGIVLIGTMGSILLMKNPHILDELKAGMSNDVPKSTHSPLTGMSDTENVIHASGITFQYPTSFEGISSDEELGELAVLVYKSKMSNAEVSQDTTYPPQVSVFKLNTTKETENLSAMDIIKKDFVPVLETDKKNGDVAEYTIGQQENGDHVFAIAKAKEVYEGVPSIYQDIIYKNKNGIYMFQTYALENDQSIIDQAINTILQTVSISEISNLE